MFAQVYDSQAALPSPVAFGQLRIVHVKDAVYELEVVLDLFVAADGEVLGRRAWLPRFGSYMSG